MRITISIDDQELLQIQQLTGKKQKSPAVEKALSEYLKQQHRESFINRVVSGETDFALTNDELEARDVYEAR